MTTPKNCPECESTKVSTEVSNTDKILRVIAPKQSPFGVRPLASEAKAAHVCLDCGKRWKARKAI